MSTYTYIAPHKDMCGRPDPDYDRRESTFDALEEAQGHLEDAWGCLYDAMKGSVYFEADKEDVQQIEDEIWQLKHRFEKIVNRYRPI